MLIIIVPLVFYEGNPNITNHEWGGGMVGGIAYRRKLGEAETACGTKDKLKVSKNRTTLSTVIISVGAAYY